MGGASNKVFELSLSDNVLLERALVTFGCT